MFQFIKKIISLISVIIILSIPSISQEQSNVDKIKVKLDVTADDSIENIIISNLNQRLRALGDVLLVDKDPDYIIHILATENASSYISSVIITVPLDLRHCLNNLFLYVDINDKSLQETIQYLIEGYECIWLHKLYKVYDFKKMCDNIVADIDVEVLEHRRKILQKLKKE